MMDDRFDDKAREGEGGAAKPERPVWSHKAEGGYLEEFLKGEDSMDLQGEAVPQPSESDAAAEGGALQERVVEALRQIYDPEIPVNIYELGLIYGVDVDDTNNVDVTMTLTTPHCPVAETMPGEVESKVRSVEGVNDVDVNLVWDPPWDMTKMSDEARLELGLL